MCILQWTHKLSLDFKRPVKGPVQYLREKERERCIVYVASFFLHTMCIKCHATEGLAVVFADIT